MQYQLRILYRKRKGYRRNSSLSKQTCSQQTTRNRPKPCS